MTDIMKLKIQYLNKLHKACFHDDMDYNDYKDLARRATFHKILHDKAFKRVKYNRYQRRLALIVYTFFD